jgi:hypothetical protein
LKPIRSRADYRKSLAELERLFGVRAAERPMVTGSMCWQS